MKVQKTSTYGTMLISEYDPEIAPKADSLPIEKRVHEESRLILGERSDNDQALHLSNILQENSLLNHELIELQASNFQQALLVISCLSEQVEQLTKEKEALADALAAEQEKFIQLKQLVEPALSQVLDKMTQDLVPKLMKKIPELENILKEAAGEDGVLDFQCLLTKLEEYSAKKKEIAITWESKLSAQEAGESSAANKGPASASLPENINDEFSETLSLFKFLQEAYGDKLLVHPVKTMDTIAIDGHQLDKRSALSMLATCLGMVGKGIYSAGRGAVYMVSTIIQLASFVGIGISLATSPSTAVFLLLGRLLFPVMRLAAGI